MAPPRKRPTDMNQHAKSIVDRATRGDPASEMTVDGKNAAAVALGRLGGLKGGKARADKLSADQRQDIARKAAEARWKGVNGNGQ